MEADAQEVMRRTVEETELQQVIDRSMTEY